MRVRATLLIVVAGLASAACDPPFQEDLVVPSFRAEDFVTHILVDPPVVTLTSVGETFRLSALALDVDGAAIPEAPIQWSSSDEFVVTVGGDGLVRAHNEGQARITASLGAVRGRAILFVDVPLGPS